MNNVKKKKNNSVYLSVISALSLSDIVKRVKAGGRSPLRPHIDGVECPEEMEVVVRSCWSERPAERPEFSSLRVTIKKLSPTG